MRKLGPAYVMRNFEAMNNGEIASLHVIKESTVSTRYIRALRRIKDGLKKFLGFLE